MDREPEERQTFITEACAGDPTVEIEVGRLVEASASGEGFLEQWRILDPSRFVLIVFAGWMINAKLLVIDYLREESRVLREQLGGRRLRLNDDQRLAV